MMVDMKAASLYILANLQTNKHHTDVLFSAHVLVHFYSKTHISFETDIRIAQAHQVGQDEAIDF